MEDKLAWHGTPLGKKTDEVISVLKGLIKNHSDKLSCELLPISKPAFTVEPNDISNVKLSKAPEYKLGQEVIFLSYEIKHVVCSNKSKIDPKLVGLFC